MAILKHDQVDQQQSEEAAAAWTDEHLSAGITSRQPTSRFANQFDGSDFSAAVYDVFVAQATGRQRRHPRAGPGMGIDL